MTPELAASLMAQALRLAERGRLSTHPNPRVGCVIARDGQPVGTGAHLRAGHAHAEVLALAEAGARARGADVFVSLEPCAHHGRTPPCIDALLGAGVGRVWVAMQDPNPKVAGRGIAALRAGGIEVDVGLMAAEALRINRGFVSRMARGRPFVTLKAGISLDARTAMSSGESQWITGADARADVHRLRADAGAVLTGSGTVLADDPQLSVRGLEASAREPDRIVVDTRMRVPMSARVWADGAARRLWLVGGSPTQCPKGVEAVTAATTEEGHLDLAEALRALAEREINAVLLECGPQLAGAFLQQGLVDEIVAYIAPMLLGHDARPLALLPGMERLSQALHLQWQDVRQIGRDLRVTAVPIPA